MTRIWLEAGASNRSVCTIVLAGAGGSAAAGSTVRGFGLVVAHAVVQAHGGAIAVESIRDEAGAVRGARATLAWPTVS